MDSDLYKALEAAAYVLKQYPDNPIRAKVDEVIDILERAAARRLPEQLFSGRRARQTLEQPARLARTLLRGASD